jgi:CrcB protein
MWKAILWVALGGSIGSVLRFLGQKWLGETWGTNFPFGTLFVNITGCLIIGYLFGACGRWPGFPPEMRLFLMTGFCGGFTTFSAFSLESLSLLQEGRFPTFFIYVTVSLAVCLLGTFIGFWIARQL